MGDGGEGGGGGSSECEATSVTGGTRSRSQCRFKDVKGSF